jgi:endoglycosylceramidase
MMSPVRRSPVLLRLAALVVGLALLAAACSDDGDGGGDGGADAGDDGSPATTGGAAGGDALPELLPLHAVRGESPAIVDEDGRQVLLRGVNLNGLGDYYQANPDLPPNVPVEESDFEEMATFGFDVVRLLVSWSRLQPEPGVIDDDYIAEIRTAVDQAGAHGIYVVLDMHQDAYSKYVATPEGETCPAGTNPAKGWDGAPEWATITDGASTCIIGEVRETSPASITAFENFWTNRDGIQDHFRDAWAALATEFAADPTVAGYDLFNEPGTGSSADQEPARLGEFYGRTIDAIRAAEAEVDDGFDHIVFFEPHAAWGTFGTMPVPEATFTDDQNIVFAPHIYAGSIAPTVTVKQGFTYAAEAAATFDVTFWSGEWGWFGEDEESLAELATYAAEEDRYMVGGTWWQWFQSCGDPHSVSRADDFQPADELTHFRRTGCPGDEDLGPVESFARVLSRTYPRAAPGRLTEFQNDLETGRAHVAGTSDTDDAVLDLWIPGEAEPEITGTGIGEVELIPVPGGHRALVEVDQTYEADITTG